MQDGTQDQRPQEEEPTGSDDLDFADLDDDYEDEDEEWADGYEDEDLDEDDEEDL